VLTARKTIVLVSVVSRHETPINGVLMSCDMFVRGTFWNGQLSCDDCGLIQTVLGESWESGFLSRQDEDSLVRCEDLKIGFQDCCMVQDVHVRTCNRNLW